MFNSKLCGVVKAPLAESQPNSDQPGESQLPHDRVLQLR